MSDFRDQCPDTLPGEVVNTNGCSIAQLVPCDGPWKNHGHYVMRVRLVSTQFVKASLLTRKQQRALIKEAVHSNCGKRR